MTGRVRNRFWRVFPPHADLAGNSVLCLYGDGGGPRLPEPVLGGPGLHDPRGAAVRASRGGTIRRHLFRAAKASALSGVILFLLYFFW